MRLIPSTRLSWQTTAVSLGTLMVLLTTLYFQPAKDLDLYLQDLLVGLMRQTSAGNEFVLLTLDEQSLNLTSLAPAEVEESRPLQLMQTGYPWSREVYGAAARQLLDAGARLVIFDMLFPSPREGDDAFARVLREYPDRIVIGSSFELSPSTQHTAVNQQFVPPTEVLAAATSAVGFVNFPSAGGRDVIRTMWPYATDSLISGHPPLSGETPVPALSTAAAIRLGREIPVTFEPLRFAYAKKGFFRTVPLYEIFVPALWKVNHREGANFKDRVVLVGATAERLQDYHFTPLGRIPGPVIQLHALSALLENRWLNQAGTGFTIATVVAAGVAVFGLVMIRHSSKWLIMGLDSVAGGWKIICAASLFSCSFFLPIAPPLLTWLVCGFAGLACDVSLERRERGRLRGMLERYVSKDIVKEIADNPDSFLQTLGGQRKEIVAMFSDLKGFTSDSERLDPAEMVALLNEYFGEMVGVVFAHHGTLDKFMGDALMATWGCIRAASPRDDARNAVMTALQMKERLMVMNASRRTRGAALWSSGIGICQGPAVFGNIGSQQKMEPTVIGDTVNLASRVEGLTRVYGCDILVDERIALNAAGECGFLPVDEVRVKGRRKVERLFFPHRGVDTAWTEDFAAARQKYLSGDFAAARDAFTKLSTGGLAPALAARFLTRCEGFLRQPPDKTWDGVWDFVDK